MLSDSYQCKGGIKETFHLKKCDFYCYQAKTAEIFFKVSEMTFKRLNK